MSSFLNYLLEAKAAEKAGAEKIFQKLLDLGYKLKDSQPSSKIIVLTKREDRVSTLKDIAASVGGTYDKNSSKSSVGAVIAGKVTVLAKPLSSAAGRSAGEAAEPMVAYMYNAMNGDKRLVEEADGISDAILDKLRSKDYSESWIQSSKKSAQKLHDKIDGSKQYQACHVNGNDLSLVKPDIKLLAQVFKSKQLAGMVLKSDKKAFEDLYDGTAKDVWNKADILLVKKDFSIDELKDIPLATGADLNAALNKLVQAKTVWPVSLKAVSPKASMEDIQFIREGNADEAKAHSSALDEIDYVEVQFPKSVDTSRKFIGTCYLKSEGFKIQFRNNSIADKDVLSIELILKGARGGKAAKALRQKLGLVKGFYRNVSITDTDDFIQQFKTLFGPLTSEQLAAIAALDKQDEKWFLRTCFKGLLSLAEAYRNKIQKKPSGRVDIVSMFKTFYNAGSGNSSDSIFWLLSMK